jgi:serine/threonine protein kinase
MNDIPHDLIGNEPLCKKKFVSMILATYQQQNSLITQRKLLFDIHGNVDIVRVVNHDTLKSEYHKFYGNAQYVPPELSSEYYSSDLADVWVLGIFLYRMLVGRFPFSAINDKQLFEKMTYGDFIIPTNLSPGL